jgi:crotonyl-CoA carboxylase/reductase
MTATRKPMTTKRGGDAPLKDLYEIGEIPPLGHVPKNMYAWAIRRERHGAPEDAMQLEVVPTWELDSHEVLVLVMAAGVNYNGIWAGLGEPISPFDGHKRRVSHCRFRCVRHRLGRRRQGEALEGRRRGRHPL